ncbi:MAG: hypothetical protein QM690_07185 [Sphingobium sp.]
MAPQSDTRLTARTMRAGENIRAWIWRFFDMEEGRRVAPPFSARSRPYLLALFALVLLLRVPGVWIHGRFLGEEGTNFFAYAWHLPAGEALWHPLGGYLNIIASGSTLLAARLVRSGWLALEWAPYLTIGAAFFFQLCPALLLLTARARWLTNRWAVLFALLALAATPETEEVWLHSLHVQFHLALCVLIMIVTDRPDSAAMRGMRIALAFLAPLCGPVAIALLPIMTVRAWIEAKRWRWIETASLAIGAAIQLSLFYTPSSVRLQSTGPLETAAVLFTRHVAMPVAGPDNSRAVGAAVHQAIMAGTFPWWAALAGTACIGAVILLALLRRSLDALLLLSAGLVVAVLAYHGGLLTGVALFNVGMGQRYNFVPQVAFYFAMIAFVQGSTGLWRRALAAIGCAMAVIGAICFFSPVPSMSKGPNWRQEVAAWRNDPEHRLKLWPEGWTMDLSPGGRPCSVRPSPDYCDAAWEARQRDELAAMRRLKF